MELQYILDKIKSDDADITKLIDKIKSKKEDIDINAVKLYEIVNHDVMINAINKRPKKQVTRTVYGLDKQPMKDAQGIDITTIDYEEVNRLPLPIQKYIVEQRMNMLLANPVELDSSATGTEENLLEVLKKTWENNKVNYSLKDLFIRQMSETEVATILVIEDAEEGHWEGTVNEGKDKKIRMSIIESDEGNALYPVFNQYSDMVAFCRAYKLFNDDTDKDVEHFDIYTADENYFYEKDGTVWILITTAPNEDKKIPVIYFSQPFVEWSDVQSVINRREVLSSNHADTNDYSGAPIAVFSADTVESLPQKTEKGKAIQLVGEGANVKYLEASGSTESNKIEYDKLEESMYMFTGTIDYNKLQNYFGSAPSGYAIKLLFQNAHLKASQKEGEFGKNVQRLVNLFKSLLCIINPALKSAKSMTIKPVFTYFLPKNTIEELDILIKAKDASLLSQETAVIKSPVTEDGEAELERIKKEKEENMKLLPSPVMPLTNGAATNGQAKPIPVKSP